MGWWPDDLLARSTVDGVRHVVLGFLDQARAAAERVAADDESDEEALHDFRVGLRRTRSALRSWKKRLPGKLARERRPLAVIQGRTGGGRDAEVAVAWLRELHDGLDLEARETAGWLIDRLDLRLRESMEALRRDGLGDFTEVEARLRDELNGLPTDEGDQRFGEALAIEADRQVTEWRDELAGVRGLEDAERIHRARILGKRLRYLVEPLQPSLPEAARVVERCKNAQDLLGDFNDASVLRDELSRSLERLAVDEAALLDERLREGATDAELTALAERSLRPGWIVLGRLVQARSAFLVERLLTDWRGEEEASLRAAVDDFVTAARNGQAPANGAT
ncbi:MAG: CHAD domain-containing protein [Acidobacteriota bacterium]